MKMMTSHRPVGTAPRANAWVGHPVHVAGRGAAARLPPPQAPGEAMSGQVRIGALIGDLSLPAMPVALILFAHGSGSSRRSARNGAVAAVLQAHGMGTLLCDLLTEEEAREQRKVYDIELLSARLMQAVDWVGQQADLRSVPIGLFGVGTGTAAAMVTAAARPGVVAALASRGGRPDLAAAALARVRAPSLLIAGGEDHEVLALNRSALRLLTCHKRLEVVPGATHLFNEPGTLEGVAALAAEWFDTHLAHHRRSFSS